MENKSSIEYWLDDDGNLDIDTSVYWNDEEIEKKKEYIYIVNSVD